MQTGSKFSSRLTNAKRKPLSSDEEARIERELDALVADPLNRSTTDLEFAKFADRQVKRVFGTDPVEKDGAGRNMSPRPKRIDLEVFRPKFRQGDLELDRSVGKGAENRAEDVIHVQRLLSNAGTFEFAVPRERSGKVSEALIRAIQRFQVRNGLTQDGLIKPNGATIRILSAQLQGKEEKRPKIRTPGEDKSKRKARCRPLWNDLINANLEARDVQKRFIEVGEGLNGSISELKVLHQKSSENIEMTTVAAVVMALANFKRTVPVILGSVAETILPSVMELVGIEGEIGKAARKFRDRKRRYDDQKNFMKDAVKRANEAKKKFEESKCQERDFKN